MTFEQKMKIRGNMLLSNLAKNPYPVEMKEKKKAPLWVKISIPSTLAVLGIIAAITISNAISPKAFDLKDYALNSPEKTFNLNHQALNKEYIKSINDFSTSYYQYEYFGNYTSWHNLEMEDRVKNYVFSPINIENQMYMLYDAADEETKNEISDLFKINDSLFNHQLEAQKMIHNTSIDYQDSENQLKFYSDFSQALFIDDEIKPYINQDYIDELTQYYYADIFCADLDTFETEKLLYEYIKNKTKGMHDYEPIELPNDLNIPEPQHYYDQKFNLVSTMLIDSSWLDVFVELGNKTFKQFNGQTTNVPFLKPEQTFYAKVYEGDDFKILAIPLLKNHSFNVLLPNNESNQQEILKNNVESLLNLETDKEYVAEVNLELPVFELEQIHDMDRFIYNNNKPILGKDGTAFPGIAGEKTWGIEGICQSIKISVEKSGISASSMQRHGSEEPAEGETTGEGFPEIDFIVNRPFAFSITGEDKVPLVVGQIQKL